MTPINRYPDMINYGHTLDDWFMRLLVTLKLAFILALIIGATT